MRAAGLVPGDIVKLSLGAVVAAHVRLVDGSAFLHQSMLTGESISIEAGAGSETRRGEAVSEITATGPRTRFARIEERFAPCSGVLGSPGLLSPVILAAARGRCPTAPCPELSRVNENLPVHNHDSVMMMMMAPVMVINNNHFLGSHHRLHQPHAGPGKKDCDCD